ncbi:hypothetical protein HGM15179_006834 [Zosterops borbonicus]|uniref:Uncharacterized protein n=1 Tax=Zosterops borbonicus TaxID=364589 RepID=A0A8K1GJQ8_9PASS|nr:hypothetical protein HGM15179_006834 [Zosterops borbonicus]
MSGQGPPAAEGERCGAVGESRARGSVCGRQPCSGLGDELSTAVSISLGKSSDILESSLSPSTTRPRPVFPETPPGMVTPPPAWVAPYKQKSPKMDISAL